MLDSAPGPVTSPRTDRSDAPPSPPAASPDATPMMAQFIAIKAANADCLLFYRMGDFYELFFEDAVIAARALGIALTKRGKHLGDDIPMCGVPVERADDYLHRLIRAGHRVAVAEQLEDPAEAKRRGAKAVVRRDVVRLVTPGTLVEDSLLDARAANWLMAIAPREDGFGAAWADMSTGALHTSHVEKTELAALVARIDPAEIVAPEGHDLGEAARARTVTAMRAASFGTDAAAARIKASFGLATLDGLDRLGPSEVSACGALLAYLDETQRGRAVPFALPVSEGVDATCRIDPATRASLELVRTLGGAREGSLLHAVDRTVTNAGARLLAERLAAPLNALAPIAQRHDEVEALLADRRLRADLAGHLKRLPDLPRALSRLSLMRGSPRDLGAARAALAIAEALRRRLSDAPPALYDLAADLGAPDDALKVALDAALSDELPARLADGGLVRAGHREDLDAARDLRDRSRRVIAGLQARYATQTGIRGLKIKHNNVLGYFVEVNARDGEALRASEDSPFVHRQTLATCVRFTTTELGDLEREILGAKDRAAAIEAEVFEALRAATVAQGDALRRLGNAAARLDVAAGLAALAEERAHVRPVMEDGLAFEIAGGRHPVVEQTLQGAPFVANDCSLGARSDGEAGRLLLVTGPNMAGKSTYLRQNALIALLAQAGAFVPASRARIGLVDRLFSRVGAADDIAHGRSTFMVEMVEAAAILNQATQASLVVMDEIGRGTATYDGLSIAWGVVEHLHETNRTRGLFATHYHELTALTERLPRLDAVHVKVKEWRGDVVFLHEVSPGAADRSYGVQVGRLAGLPLSVVRRAKAILADLESGGGPASSRLMGELPLFAGAATPPAAEPDPEAEHARDVLRRLREADLDAMSPREAQALLYALKEAAG